MTEREIEIEEVLRAVPTVCDNLKHPGECREVGCVETGYPDFPAMARAVVALQALADRDARLARLVEALRGLLACIDDQVFVRNTVNDDHFASYVAQGGRIVNVLKSAQDALADAGAGR